MSEIEEMVRKIHKIKDEMNSLLRRINNVPGLEIKIEIIESPRMGDERFNSPFIEISILQEIYPG